MHSKIIVNIEVKRNFNDLNSKRSQQQINDMTKSSNKRKQAQITYVSTPGCYIPQNKLGKKIIENKGLRKCRIK